MANYKVVDADQLDSNMLAVADAIRERACASGKLAFPEGMVETVKNIPSGAEFPSLYNPGSVGDLLEGKQLIDAHGNVIVGTIPVYRGEVEYL